MVSITSHPARAAVQCVDAQVGADVIAVIFASQRAGSEGAEFPGWAYDLAGTAVVGVGVCIDAGSAAILKAFVTAVLAHAQGANLCAVACEATDSAVVGVRPHVDTLVVAHHVVVGTAGVFLGSRGIITAASNRKDKDCASYRA